MLPHLPGSWYLRGRPRPPHTPQQLRASGCKRPLLKHPFFRNDQVTAVFQGIHPRNHIFCPALAGRCQPPAGTPGTAPCPPGRCMQVPREARPLGGLLSPNMPAPVCCAPLLFNSAFHPGHTNTPWNQVFWGAVSGSWGALPQVQWLQGKGLRGSGLPSLNFCLKRTQKEGRVYGCWWGVRARNISRP